MSTYLLPEFELLLPNSIEEAVSDLSKYGSSTAILAGGTDLLIQMKNGYRPSYVLSLASISDLNKLHYHPSEGLTIGAMVSMNKVLEISEIEQAYPALWQAMRQNGTPQTRNVATVVGNILRASPCGDCSCAILAHGGEVVLAGPSGKRSVNIKDFFLGYMLTERKPDEIAVEVKLPPPRGNVFSAFAALNRNGQDLSKISTAVSLEMDGPICRKARIAMGAVAPIPVRVKRAERVISGSEITEDVIERMSKTAQEEITPIDDVRSTAEYRRAVCGTIIRRTMRSALGIS